MSKDETVILEPGERYIHLSSEYAIKSTTTNSSDVRFPIGSPIAHNDPAYCMFIGVHNATIPHTWYNMNGYNWRISFSNPSVPFVGSITGTLPIGNYSSLTLASALQSSVRAAQLAVGLPNTFTVTYNSDTNFYTFTDGLTGPGTTRAWAFESVINNCYLELGLRDLFYGNIVQVYSQSALGGTVWSLVPESMSDLSGYHGIYVNFLGYTSNALSSYNRLNQASIIARIPIKQPFGAIESYEPQNITYVPIPNAVLTDIQIQLTGDDGRLLSLNGIDWTMTLHVKYGSVKRTDSPLNQLLPGNIMDTQILGGRRVY